MSPSASTPTLLLAALALVACSGCGGDDPASTPGGKDVPTDVFFRDVTERVRVDFTHHVVRSRIYALREVMGSGCAVFDADGDGLLDLYFLDAGTAPENGATNRFYRRTADGHYEDRTEESGLGDQGYGMGVAVGDVNNDGALDVYVGNDGHDRLYLGDGDGTFRPAPGGGGIESSGWTSSVAFLDYDADGWLDIFVVHYVTYDPAKVCDQGGRRDYCSPRSYRAQADTLYRNRGDGTFEDVSESVGIADVPRNGLGLVVDDFDDDGRLDVFVANDGEANQLWINTGDGFEDRAVTMGVAVNGLGAAEASMGVAFGDVTGDGALDLFMTHLRKQTNTLYVRDGDWGFVDATEKHGLGRPSTPFTGFGTVLFDADLDGDLDLAIVNGRVARGPRPAGAPDDFWSDYLERNQFFLNDGGRFAEPGERSGDFVRGHAIGRGLAVADLDGDGDLDLVSTACAGPARIYENTAPRAGGGVSVRVRDEALRRDVYGARVVARAGDRSWRRTVGPALSYMTSSAIGLHFGIGAAGAIDAFEVVWPGGGREVFPGCRAGDSVVLLRGKGRKP